MKLKVLVIEDDPSVLDNLKDILTLAGFVVVTAHNGREGVDAAKLHCPDIIICDVMMPEMDGYAVVQAIRQETVTSTIPFIFLTAKADRQALREGMNAGADDYLTKPFKPEDVIDAVKARLERHDLAMQRYQNERDRAQALQQQAQDIETISQMKANLLSKISEDLREPLGNINLALHMLGQAKTEAERDRYLNVLKQEYNREMTLLKEVANLQELISPENIKVLRQFKLLQRDS